SGLGRGPQPELRNSGPGNRLQSAFAGMSVLVLRSSGSCGPLIGGGHRAEPDPHDEATGRILAPSVARVLVRQAAQPPSAAPVLTPREREVLQLVAAGLSNRVIGLRLHVGEATVKTHLLHVFAKLEVNDRSRAVTRAMELGPGRRVRAPHGRGADSVGRW
ncbi:response regulator transcription factor, partial [Microbacterium lushaniae]